MDTLTNFLHLIIGLNSATQTKLLNSIIVIFLFWLIRKLILIIVFKRVADVRIRYQWRKSSTYIASVFGILIVGRIWIQGFQSIATFLGLLSAGMAIALKDLLSDLAGWAFIIWRRPLEVEDRVQIGDHAGDVVDIRIFQFTLLEIGNWVAADQSTGRIIHIPNGRVFTDVMANYSKGFQYIWNEIPILVTFESNWQKAKDILLKIAAKHAECHTKSAEKKLKEAARKFLIFYTKLTTIVYTSVKDSGILLTIRYLCEPRNRRGSEQSIWEDVLLEFAKHSDIDFAYPTQRFYNNLSEGKTAVKPASEHTIPKQTDKAQDQTDS
jgi:small-conductance mechanosensitive channel